MSAIGPHRTAVHGGTWDTAGVITPLANEPSELRYVHAWVDPDGDPSELNSYRFRHHVGFGSPAILSAVTDCLARLPYSNIPAGERAAVRRHLEAHLNTARAASAVITINVDQQGEAEPAQTVNWVSDLVFEGEATEDGRYILPGALGWREVPQTLMALTETGPGGHQGAFAAGKILSIEKDTEFDMDGEPLPEGVTAIRAHGEFDMAGPNGAEIARLVEGEIVRGVSVDLTNMETVWRDAETGELHELATADSGMQMAVKTATIGMATVCPLPAFARTKIAVTASGLHWLTARIRLEIDALTASAAGLAPAKPPRDWFYMDEPDTLIPLTVAEDGCVYGHVAPWEGCHTGFPGQCVPPPKSASGYAYFNLGEVETLEGERVPCGSITLDTLHAETRRPITAEKARAHYDHTGVVAAFVRAIDGKHGIWVSGALRADLPERFARDLMGGKPSGDWRQIRPGGPLEMIGVHTVNKPGYPIPRMAASAVTASGAVVSFEFGDETWIGDPSPFGNGMSVPTVS